MSEAEPEFDTLVRSLRDVEGAQARLDSVAALAFDAGNGPGAYEVLLGRGRGALPLALLVDLGVEEDLCVVDAVCMGPLEVGPGEIGEIRLVQEH